MYYDVIIIGAGSMGMAAGYYIAKKGKKVLLIDEYDPPHSEGSHHGDSRIIRHAYGEGLSYVPMALRSQELWAELQKSTDELLFSKTGVLTVGASESEFIQNILKSADTHSLSVQKLTSEEIHDKWTGFSVPDEMIGCFEENSGVLFSEACIRTYKNLAVDNGAVLKMNTKVTGISIVAGTVTVEIEQGSFKGDSLIVATGKGTPDILAFLGLNLPLRLVRKTFSWFSSDESVYGSERFPAFSFELPGQLYYGFPSLNGAGVKIGRHDGGQLIPKDRKLKQFGEYPADIGDVDSFASSYLPRLNEHKSGRTCTYTNTLDGHFIIDKHNGNRFFRTWIQVQ